MTQDWWRDAVIYQVYVRSFADSDGDGVGDLPGIRSRLPHLADLGVDAVWITPFYRSPMADGGYDVADYRTVDPLFGSNDDAKALLDDAHDLGLRVIVDLVPNHTSDRHAWFQQALRAAPGSPERARYHFRDGRGEGPPNDWESVFGGPAWTRTADGQWYLHLFAPEQPDFNWDNPKVREEFEDILRFWFQRGVDGVRIDSAAVCMKEPSLADFDRDAPPSPHPYEDRDEVHPIYQGWRVVADSYPDRRALIGEIWLPDAKRFALYLRPDEMHTAFNFDFLACEWGAASFKRCIDETLAAHAPVGAPATWVLSNHDVTRHVTRYGRQDTTFSHDATIRRRQHQSPVDFALGRRRGRAAALLTFALPGSVYVYQGDELGLAEVEDIPDSARQDPMFSRTHGFNPGRDGCRVPLPWSGTAQPFGFSPYGASGQPWLPQPAEWAAFTAEAQTGDPASMLELYRSALHLRRTIPGFGDGPMRWLDSPADVLAFERDGGVACVINLSDSSVALPAHEEILIASGPLDSDGCLPTDTTVWLRTA